MTSFKITNDDVGVRGIQESNKSPVISGPVMPIKASTPVQKSPENHVLSSAAAEHKNHEHLHAHRRHDDRRKEQQHVLLETRSQLDRRSKTEHGDDPNNDDATTTQHGIDEMI